MIGQIDLKKIGERIDAVLGAGVTADLLDRPKQEIRGLAGKMVNGLMEETKKELVGEDFPKEIETLIGNTIRDGEGDYKVVWDLETKLREIMDSKEETLVEKIKAVKWQFWAEITKLVCPGYIKPEELVLGIAKMLELDQDGETVKRMYKEWRESLTTVKENKGKMADYFLKLVGEDLVNSVEIEVEDGVILLYRNGHESEYFPAVTLFPGLTEEEITRVEEALEQVGEIGIPGGYKDFLEHHNGLSIGFDFYLWGIRRSYNPEKHLEQHSSLINSSIDRTLATLLPKTEVVIASDRQRNIYTMDIVSGAIFGWVRPNGDELATPEKITFASLGELLRKQVEKELQTKR